MKKAKGEEGSISMDMISDLPKDILQRILSLLSQKDAVRTSALSKSWRYVWCTRPNLDFSDDTFVGSVKEFQTAVDNALQRYRDQSLCLEEFRLSIWLDGYLSRESVSLLDKWIPLFRNMGVKDFRLSVISGRQVEYVTTLPGVVLEAESLKYLYVRRFGLSPGNTILFKRIKRIHLDECRIDGDMLDKIISSCPLIESMHLERCRGLADVKVNGLRNLKDFYYEEFEEKRHHPSIEIDYPSSLETVNIIYGDMVWFRNADFCMLDRLYLHGVSSSFELFSTCEFPILKSLFIISCSGLEESSNLYINAPNILYFEYNSDRWSTLSISFATTSNEWDSHVTLPYWPSSSDKLVSISQLLNSLSQSKIFLTISRCALELPCLSDVPYNGCNKPVAVEGLKLKFEVYSFSFRVRSIFQSCRPRKIYVYFVCKWDLVYLWESALMQGESGNQDQLREQWHRDLEEVRVEIYDDRNNGWHPITLSSGSEFPECREWENISPRFSLKWREA
ncbi:hypothetical protein MIMGU_mgv11b017558mg [Erythranthe guttata]|uniref:F-box domain-containing protein n=1 Tax=Erythranthe guttata TaxID=4155 RepID=A0A022QNA1_ERYGU|nr:PREDICTED: F-box/FBD/LRR-repeat protein At5g53840-like [Erythranthe guttata]EYU30187.1 hypothetical protein MIMGU_mgv11b017558mg [Erythranthe guttata]|eukprot:XP_012846042.1 PREDICTED: F-box/FBD/LRR-repeat protein At5g53840-like [Erythranthe guttata]